MTTQDKALFLEYAKKASQWAGMPLVEGPGHIKALKAWASTGTLSLVRETPKARVVWVSFSDVGRTLAEQNGVKIPHVDPVKHAELVTAWKAAHVKAPRQAVARNPRVSVDIENEGALLVFLVEAAKALSADARKKLTAALK